MRVPITITEAHVEESDFRVKNQHFKTDRYNPIALAVRDALGVTCGDNLKVTAGHIRYCKMLADFNLDLESFLSRWESGKPVKVPFKSVLEFSLVNGT